MACRGAAKRDDLLVVDGRQDEEVGAEVHNGSQGPERIDAEEDWSHTLVQSVDLDLSIVASGCHSDFACAEAVPCRTIPKPKQWLVVLVHLGQASIAMFGLTLWPFTPQPKQIMFASLFGPELPLAPVLEDGRPEPPAPLARFW